jgi:hypothetical protein
MNRRGFLKKGTTGAVALTASSVILEPLAKAYEEIKNRKPIPRRKLGKTGEELSIVGFAGIVVMNNSQSFANNIVAEAVDRGINYFDVAPTYGDAQARLGPALEPFRKNVFLACKEEDRPAIQTYHEERRAEADGQRYGSQSDFPSRNGIASRESKVESRKVRFGRYCTGQVRITAWRSVAPFEPRLNVYLFKAIGKSRIGKGRAPLALGNGMGMPGGRRAGSPERR